MIGGSHLILRYSALLPDTEAGRIVKHYSQSLADHQAGDLVIVIDGGSQTMRGLDGDMLSRRLEANGVPNSVVQISFGGANVMERDFTHELLMSRLSADAKQAVANSPTLYLIEAFSDYSFEPFAKAHENKRSSRVVDYLTLSRTLDYYRLTTRFKGPRDRVSSRFVPADARKNSAMTRDEKIAAGYQAFRLFLAKNVILNGMNIGRFEQWVSPHDIRPTPGFDDIARQREFEFVGTQTILDHFDAPEPWRSFAVSQMINVRTRTLDGIWGSGRAGQTIFFGMPSVMHSDVNHLVDVCQAAKEAQTCLTYDDVALMAALDEKRFWRDRIHLTDDGAEIFSDWFADRMAERLSAGTEATAGGER